MNHGSTLIARRSWAGATPEPGEYYSSDTALYRVERVLGDRVLIEDCRTEALIDISIAELTHLNPVRPSSDEAGAKSGGDGRGAAQGSSA